MKKKIIGIFVCMLLIGTVLSVSGNVDVERTTIRLSSGNTLYVGGSGPGNYTSIQGAIDDAEDGDTVFVYDDSSPYYENVVVDESINLVGEDKATTIIDGDYNKCSVVDIREDGVLVSGFTIIKCWFYAIILRRCGNAVIKDNIISIGIENGYSDPFGIYLVESRNNLIQENKIFNSKGLGDGISSYTSARESYFNNISGNEIFGFKWGINIENYDDVILYNNYIYNNMKIGIRIKNSAKTLISNNIIIENGYDRPRGGILLDNCENITITNNHISNNNPEGVYLYQSINNKIHQNNFINNKRNAYFSEGSSNSWNKNYWNKPRLFPKLIFGKINFGDYSFPWFNFDWKPAQEPYDIGV